ncbi:hypothetical protein GGD87_000222 [Rhodobaca bogoriensis DSM 18756]|nr:hypothetical protein [Rhodobaca bogoriensis DSM 18756]
MIIFLLQILIKPSTGAGADLRARTQTKGQR